MQSSKESQNVKVAVSEHLARRSQGLLLRGNTSESGKANKNEKKYSGGRVVNRPPRIPFTVRCPVVNAVAQLNLPEIPHDVVNIDAAPFLSCTLFDHHYGREIISYMKQLEIIRSLPRDYLLGDGNNFNGRIRGVLVDWLIQVQTYLELSEEALHLCVKIIDHTFASKCRIVPDQFQLVAVAAFLISCKVVERFPPKIASLLHLTDDTYTSNEVLKMERVILNNLNFILVLPDPVIFLDRCYLISGSKDKQLTFLSHFLTDLMMVNVKSVYIMPSLLAAAAFCLAMKILYKGKDAIWSKTYGFYSGYDEDSLKEMMQLMVMEVLNKCSSEFKGAWNKYSSTRRYLNVSNLPHLKPALMEKVLED